MMRWGEVGGNGLSHESLSCLTVILRSTNIEMVAEGDLMKRARPTRFAVRISPSDRTLNEVTFDFVTRKVQLSGDYGLISNEAIDLRLKLGYALDLARLRYTPGVSVASAVTVNQGRDTIVPRLTFRRETKSDPLSVLETQNDSFNSSYQRGGDLVEAKVGKSRPS
eukprot:GHVN01073215.1.p1 GENE.GHVN01073215.1~~GHVN01073215.1.p1  ORF type:complete len:166 (-),score=1.03 GHVN01073215.1:1054-1551(-)